MVWCSASYLGPLIHSALYLAFALPLCTFSAEMWFGRMVRKNPVKDTSFVAIVGAQSNGRGIYTMAVLLRRLYTSRELDLFQSAETESYPL